jgi:hypothetical protein
MKQNINEVKRMQQLAGLIKENKEISLTPEEMKYLTPEQIRLIKSKDDSGESEAIEWRKLEAIITNLAPYHTLENIIDYIKEVYDDAKKKINEGLNEVSDDDKALGILFHPNDDEKEVEETPYVWDQNAYNTLVKDMGYKDYEDIAGEMTHYFSPADEDEIRIFRERFNNPNLQPEDITIGMYKQVIGQEFPDK